MYRHIKKTITFMLIISFLFTLIIPVQTLALSTGVKEQTKSIEPVNENDKKKTTENKNASFNKDRILVKLDSTKYSTNSVNANISSFKNNGIIKLEKVFPDKSKGKFKTSSKSGSKTTAEWYKASVKEGTDILKAVEALSKVPGVVSAEPDYIRSLSDLGIPDNSTDEQMAEQWYLNKLGVKEAWSYLQSQGINPGGSRDVVVAVIDTGVDYNHPDLVGNIWTNTGEIPGNGIDDDSNGFVDDIHGANTVGDSYSGESGNPMDDNGHGTHVAGIIAAQGNNNFGGTGIAFNVQIMPIKAAQSSGVLTSSDIAQAIYYAADKGADVINMSFGGYGRSVVEEDALQVAYGISVLIAAAGNNGRPNETIKMIPGIPMYPAAYPWVVGVMAEMPAPAANGDNLAGFSNWDAYYQNSLEYEVMAPGVDIFSTMPNSSYAKWDGTSMAAPVVAGIAALIRSKFTDKNVYSSRFIMGQVVSTGPKVQGITPVGTSEPIFYNEINAFSALTNTPKPEITVAEIYTFDSVSIDANNNGNGVVDAGETIDIAQVIRNHWGKSDDVIVKMDSNSNASIPDPYVTFINDTVNYGAVGNFASDDNGLTYDVSNTVNGVSSPFRIKISSNTPNDHLIKLNVSITARNGFDSADTTTYNSTGTLGFEVRHGTELPRIIDKDMTLTKDNYWIIPDKTLIKSGVTVTVMPGTHIQFWGSDSLEAYAEQQMAYLQVEGRFICAGTEKEPVEIYTSNAYKGYNIGIYSTYTMNPTNPFSLNYPILGGYSELKYTKISNPDLAVNVIEHCYFSQDFQSVIYKKFLTNGQLITTPSYWCGPSISADKVINSIFYKMGNNYQDGSMLRIDSGELNNCLFDTCVYFMGGGPQVPIRYPLSIKNNVFLKNYNSTGASKANILPLDSIENNAILNNWLIIDTNKWMRFFSDGDKSLTSDITNNYWGTNSKQLIEKSIFVDFNKPFINYEPILTTAPETVYPFVIDAYVSTELQERVSKVGAEGIKIHVAFNRDMNQSVQPQVSFGPDDPTTDYLIKGNWVDERHWEGAFDINPITGDGYQFIRVAGAVAADDSWLVTANDSQRFKFEIVTSGTESMNLQATGSEGKIALSWTQDDFDLLAGYYIYRSEIIDGTYIKINSTIIPKEQKTYEDSNVVPGKAYYYKFTVLKTDLTESDFSNIAAAAALDTVPPVIAHTPIKGVAPGLALQVYADVTDNVSVAKVTLNYRKSGTTTYTAVEMTKTTGNRYSATIEGSKVQTPGIEYYIETTDGISIVRNGSPVLPNKIVIVDAPKITSVSPNEGPQIGLTSVIITGTNFKQGAKVKFGEVPASNVVVNSDSKITAVTPSNNPSTVDVTVTNTDGFSDTMLRAFTYKMVGVDISIANAQANKGTIFEVPISVSNVSGLKAADIKVTFNKDLLKATKVRLGNITSPSFTLEYNVNTLGQVIFTMASATAVDNSGVIAYIEFEVLNTEAASSPLTLEEVSLNGGTIVASKINGTFTMKATHFMKGSINYYSNYMMISGANLNLKGTNSYSSTSDSNGSYSIDNIENGDYVLKASKSNEADGISPYDAALILQASAQLTTLSGDQQTAGDVNCDGMVNSMDAAAVLENVAGLTSLPFQGSGKVWAFTPSEKSFTGLNIDLAGQNFTAILIGDVSGNWKNSGSGVQSGESAEFSIDTNRIEPGSTIKVPLKLNMGQGNLYGSEIVINYDKSLLTVVSVEKGELSGNFAIASNLATPGVIRIAMASASPISGAGVLLNINFKAENIAGIGSVILDKADVNENSIKSVINNGKIVVGIMGDANLDNEVNDLDLQLVADNYGQTNSEIDMNGDNKIDLYDLVEVGKRIEAIATGTQTKTSINSISKVDLVVQDKTPSADVFDIRVNLKDVTNFYGGSFDMLFDPKVVNIVGITPGDIFGNKKDLTKDVVYKFDNNTGEFSYCTILTKDADGINGSGTFVTIQFKVVGNGTFKINSVQSSFEDINVSGTNTRFMLSNNNAVPISYTTNSITKDILIDKAAPVVKETFPSMDDKDVPVNSVIQVTFNEDIMLVMKADTKKPVQKISLQETGGSTVAVNYSITGNTLVINPMAQLNSGVIYTVIIPTGIISDKAGNMLNQSIKFSFTTKTEGPASLGY